MIVDNAFEYFLQYKWVIFLSISLLSTFARFINSLFQDYPQHDGYATLLNYCCWIMSMMYLLLMVRYILIIDSCKY